MMDFKEQEALLRDYFHILTYQLNVIVASAATFYMTIWFFGTAYGEHNLIYALLGFVMMGMSWFVQMAWEPDSVWDNYEGN